MVSELRIIWKQTVATSTWPTVGEVKKAKRLLRANRRKEQKRHHEERQLSRAAAAPAAPAAAVATTVPKEDQRNAAEAEWAAVWPALKALGWCHTTTRAPSGLRHFFVPPDVDRQAVLYFPSHHVPSIQARRTLSDCGLVDILPYLTRFPYHTNTPRVQRVCRGWGG